MFTQNQHTYVAMAPYTLMHIIFRAIYFQKELFVFDLIVGKWNPHIWISQNFFHTTT